MEWWLFLKIAREIFPKTSELFLSCGAEPLMAQRFPDVLKEVKLAEIPFVAFTTNALLFKEDTVKKVIAAGVNEVYISFDGANEKTFAEIRGGASMKKVTGKIRLINEVKASLSTETPKIELHLTLMRRNIEELADVIDIAHELNVPRVTAFHVYPFKDLDVKEESLENHKDLYNTCLEAAKRRASELGVELEAPPPFAEEAAGPYETGGISNTSGSQKDSQAFRTCILPWTSLMIMADGLLYPCSYWFGGKAFGNLNSHNFNSIWYGPEYRQLRKEIRTGALRSDCAGCPGRQFSP